MRTFKFFTSDQGLLAVSLYSLEEYEADGGSYDDSGNGGEAVARDSFVCAAVPARYHNEEVEESSRGLRDEDIIELSGIGRADWWLDTATGYFLLRNCPAKAPLEARLNR